MEQENFSVVSVQKKLLSLNPSGHLLCRKSNNTHGDNKNMAANSRLQVRQEQEKPFYALENPRTTVWDLGNVIQTGLGPDQESGWRREL